jgi:DNA-binding CsgD family transcriptional regulator
VLPLGKSEVRHEMGKGYCAVFVALRGEQLPVMTEMLRALFDLTPAEAKISTLIGQGDRPTDIATNMDVSINTVRTHLARVFSKTDTPDQSSLMKLLKQLSPPVRDQGSLGPG